MFPSAPLWFNFGICELSYDFLGMLPDFWFPDDGLEDTLFIDYRKCS